MRKKIIVKKGLCGSSDFNRVMVKKNSLERSHRKFINSPEYKEYQEIVVERKPLTPEVVLQQYTEVWYFGGWRPLKKFDMRCITIFIKDKANFR